MKTMMRTSLLILAVVGQSVAAPGEASGQMEQAARAAVDQLFEGMRTADPELVRAVLAQDARFTVLDERDGPRRIRAQAVDGWVNGIGASGGSWDEQIYDVEVQVDGTMASIWAPYTFYLNGEISHCGINSIELLLDAEGWKITQISDTRRGQNCPDPNGA